MSDTVVKNFKNIHMQVEKNEDEMLQIELYVSNLDHTQKLFEDVFDLYLIEEKPGWRHLRHKKNFDIMLFSPKKNKFGEVHWSLPEPGTGGKGIEIVICTVDVQEKLKLVKSLGYSSTDLRYPPWGSIEFIFHLDEGYLLRVKQPPKLIENKHQ